MINCCATVIEAPAIRIEPLDQGALRSALGQLAMYKWLVVTSRNAVDLLWAALRELGLDARAFSGMKLCAVGPATADALNAVRARGGRIVAVGTTSLRLLESAARDDRTIAPFCGETAIFITPGHRFRAVDVLVTNFHLPRSTLFMLVAAFSGLDTMRAAYAHAIANGYRFYSYGDACLLFPGQV